MGRDRRHDPRERIRELTERRDPPRAARPRSRRSRTRGRRRWLLLARERFAEALELPRPRSPRARAIRTPCSCGRCSSPHSGRLEAAEAVCSQLRGRRARARARTTCWRSAARTPGTVEAAVEHDQVAAYLDPRFAMPHLHLGLLARRAGDLRGRAARARAGARAARPRGRVADAPLRRRLHARGAAAPLPGRARGRGRGTVSARETGSRGAARGAAPRASTASSRRRPSRAGRRRRVSRPRIGGDALRASRREIARASRRLARSFRSRAPRRAARSRRRPRGRRPRLQPARAAGVRGRRRAALGGSCSARARGPRRARLRRVRGLPASCRGPTFAVGRRTGPRRTSGSSLQPAARVRGVIDLASVVEDDRRAGSPAARPIKER